jgi:hypothetical protein
MSPACPCFRIPLANGSRNRDAAGIPTKAGRPRQWQAVGRALEELFARPPDRHDVTVFGAEPRVSYDRIMLSPVLSGEKRFEDIIVHDDAWYARNKVDLRKGETAVAIDRRPRPCAPRLARSSPTTTSSSPPARGRS